MCFDLDVGTVFLSFIQSSYRVERIGTRDLDPGSHLYRVGFYRRLEMRVQLPVASHASYLSQRENTITPGSDLYDPCVLMLDRWHNLMNTRRHVPTHLYFHALVEDGFKAASAYLSLCLSEGQYRTH